jgi:A/G-specific adenine glycosylase
MTKFANRLLAWYRHNGRELPWRGHPDPYAVWVSEVMLQQTRVETVIPYFKRWMGRFPSVAELASASEQEVLNAWEGLGYYGRARNLQHAAQIVVTELGGELPRDLKALRQLPGIGRYTAGAIASIAFGLDEPTLDGNLRRVLARVFNLEQPADASSGERVLWSLAAENLPPGRAGDYNQALMDLGATICTPHDPACARCPVSGLCRAYALGIQGQRPVLKTRAAIPQRFQAAAVVSRRGRVLLARRPSKGLLGGMWEFPKGDVIPNGEVDGDPPRELETVLETEYGLRARVGAPLGRLKHAYTHFRVQVHAYRCELVSIERNERLKWVRLSELGDYPMGKVDRRIARRLTEGAGR